MVLDKFNKDNIKSYFERFYHFFLNLIYNQKCVICSCAKTDDILCKNCLKDVDYLSSFAQRVYKNIPIFCAASYNKTVKKLIQLLKFSHKKICAKALAKVLFEYYQKLDIKNESYIVTFPPSYFTKSAQRGYKHMFLIAKEFSKLANLEYNLEFKGDLIIKTKPTKPQYKVRNRHKNIKDSFKINKKYINELTDKKILIIDDITTSGATIEEIINCFLDDGIKNLTCLIIAKAGC